MKLRILLLAIAAIAAFSLAGITVAQVAAFQHRPKLKPASLPARPLTSAAPAFGDALSGLDAAQLQAFADGREEFESVETVEGGLGPIFNNSSCAACHTAGATGGASAITVTRFGRLVNGVFDAMEAQGGSLLQSQAIAPRALEHVPAEATIVAQRITTALFGAGLIEAIADDDIVNNARRPQPDGVHGRAALVTDVTTGSTRVGRFGWKAQQATLLAFAGDAYLNEMGVTNRFFPTENAPNGNQALLKKYDRVPELEDAVNPATGRSDIDAAADFMRYLAPPPPLRLSASALVGARLFAQLGCTACHLPSMVTGANQVAALAGQVVPLYSDLLLHDMGSLGDGIAQAAAGRFEMRTAPLWGLRARGPFLHDGRAKTVADAIRAHDGEAAPARVRFNALPAPAVQQVLDFLGTI
jgi:CxxC motif-containing protein (DUF1111 family)